MMHRLLLVPALLMCMASTDARPRTHVTVTGRVDAASVWVIYSISSTNAPDSVRVTITGPSTQFRSFVGGSKKDSVSFPHPAEGATISGAVTAQPWKRGAAYPTSGARAWTFTEPVTPPVTTVDSVIVRPASWTGPSAAKQQFCAITRFHDGSNALATNSDTIPYCQQVLVAYRMGA